jgi:hypothetical protein
MRKFDVEPVEENEIHYTEITEERTQRGTENCIYSVFLRGIYSVKLCVMDLTILEKHTLLLQRRHVNHKPILNITF